MSQFYNFQLPRLPSDNSIAFIVSPIFFDQYPDNNILITAIVTFDGPINKVLTAFFDAFEFCRSKFHELDHVTPANELNELIGYYKTQLKAQTTPSKKHKKEA